METVPARGAVNWCVPGDSKTCASRTQRPVWQIPTLQAIPFPCGTHVPGLQRFLPCFFLHLPVWHCSHSPHACLHLPDFLPQVGAGGAPTQIPTAPPTAVSSARRRLPKRELFMGSDLDVVRNASADTRVRRSISETLPYSSAKRRIRSMMHE
jgi:hypothetical protein